MKAEGGESERESEETHREQGPRDEVRSRVKVERIGRETRKVPCENSDAKQPC